MGVIKYTPIPIPIPDIKPHFRTKRTALLTYCSALLFITFTIFLAFGPSSNSTSPWFTNIFSINNPTSPKPSSSIFSDQSYRSHFPSIYYYFFPNSSSSSSSSSSINAAGSQSTELPVVANQTSDVHKVGVLNPNNSSKGSSNINNQTQSNGKVGVLNPNNSSEGSSNINQTQGNGKVGGDKVGVLKANQTTIGDKTVNSSSIVDDKKQSNGTNVGNSTKGIATDDLIKSLNGCNLFDGNWVRDESYPLYKPGSCSLIDDQFNCFLNGRPDNGYLKLKWKPKGCTLPRLDGGHMLELLRGKRLVFVGDSLNRNMWESLICILRSSVKDQKKVYEEFGRHKFRAEASYSFVFEDYKCKVEFFVSPFLVREWEAAGSNGAKKETLRLDLLGDSAHKYKNADIIVFNTGHWWTHDKTAKGKDYYQEGSHIYSDLNVLEAFRKALTTWGRWVDANVNPAKSLVFFRGYSASHFRGGQWNSGGACDHETEPIKNETYLSHYPSKMMVLERVLRGMKTRVSYLNVTRMTDFRKDGHPSMYRKQHKSDLSFQDCSHWCLPGVPDTWNEILYAQLLLKLNH